MSKVIIKHNDMELSRVLAAALSRELPEAKIVLACGNGPDGCFEEAVPGTEDILLDESRLSPDFSFLPVHKLAAELRPMLAGTGEAAFAAAGQPAKPEECVFIGMTSGCGGSGLTSSALALGRIYARLYGLRTLYLSLARLNACAASPGDASHAPADAGRLVLRALSGQADRGFMEAFLQRDEYGLYYFSSASLLNPFCLEDAGGLLKLLAAMAAGGGFERTVLDIPADHPALFELLAASEKRVVVFGPDETRRGTSERLFSAVPGAKELIHEWDPDSFGPEGADIHGQFGAEVRALAERLEAETAGI